MVSTRSGKSAKPTYAERVLRAYSQAQRSNRRQSIHLATLRANVRKNAQEKKDKLGPQWMSWVGRAVKKLEGQGILQPDANGYVRMTDEGKKALAAARRRVLGTSGHDATLAEEDQVWRAMNEQLSPTSHFTTARRYSIIQSGKKRRQSMRSRPSVGVREDESEYDNYGEPSASTRTSPMAKKRRITSVDPFASATPSKLVSRMTKAELAKKVMELQSTLTTSQAATPTEHQQSTAEGQRLRKELHEARKELDVYRRRTAIFGDQDEELTDIEDDRTRPGRWTSPVGETHVTPLTPTPMRGRPNILALPRTESGSLIHGVSKQPTPAPSDDVHWDSDDRQEMGYAAHDDDMGALPPDVCDRRVTVEGGQVITPDMTPARQIATEKDQEIENLRADLARKNEALATLAEKDNTINDLQTAIASRTAELAQYHDSLVSKDRRISELQTSLEEATSTISEKDAILAQKDRELSDALAKLTDREATLGALNEQLAQKEDDINALRSERQHMCSEKEELEAKMASAQKAVDQAQTDYADTKGLNVDLETELNSTRSRLQDVDERNTRTEGLLRVARQQLLETESTLRARDKSLAEKDMTIANKDVTISELTVMIQTITPELVSARDSVDDLTNRLRSTAAEQANMGEELHSVVQAAQAEKDLMTIALSVLRGEKESLEAQREELRQQVDTLTHNLRGARAEYTSAKEAILKLLGTLDEARSARDDETREKETVKQALGKADAEGAKLRDRIHGAEMEMQDIRGELAVNQVALVAEQTTTSMLRSEMTAARGEFSMLKAELETARKNLIDARADIKRAEGEREEVKIAKQVDENKIAEIAVTYEKMKRLMSEMDKKFTSVPALPSQRVGI